MDAQVVRRVEERRAHGRRPTPSLFVRVALTEFLTGEHRKELPITLHRPGAADEQLGLALICNTAPWTYLGNRPVLPCPDASFDTGLDLFALRKLGTISTMRYVRQINSRRPKLRRRPLVALHDVAELTLTADRPLPFQVDGDDLGDRSEIAFTAVPGALRVLV